MDCTSLVGARGECDYRQLLLLNPNVQPRLNSVPTRNCLHSQTNESEMDRLPQLDSGAVDTLPPINLSPLLEASLEMFRLCSLGQLHGFLKDYILHSGEDWTLLRTSRADSRKLDRRTKTPLLNRCFIGHAFESISRVA